ncbi:MAG: hypothetical protein HY280_01480 [Nitrospinae bacterium]|nr:hypothetical protein [Nitrospinota bacterium]
MLDDIGDGRPLSEEEPAPAIPSHVTAPKFATGVKEILAVFIGRLVKHGVQHELINKALSDISSEIHRVSSTANKDISNAISDYLYRKELEKNRVDYLGRVLLGEMEQFFPRNQEVADRLLAEPVQGFVPIQVAEGLIFALKKTHGADVIDEYEKLCARKAESYRNKEDGLVDNQKFFADQEIKSLVQQIITRFRLFMHKKPEAEQKKWILNQITSAPAFQPMHRDVTDEELHVITRAFLKKG